ncbi:hypothetical protein DP939_42045 [Spongiactinospora rosea]|uniref:Lactococcin 972 family bacteriocin n=1 Tax=Spongiactinospora rosea TaxID=2248750 RepID=A0A366LJX9_9ACTN|nr:hypothetical protein DP939_42045 [Spongiactinospora rosea]
MAAVGALFTAGAGAAVAEPAPTPGPVSFHSRPDFNTFGIVHVGGGIWDSGIDSSKVWSNYFHGGKCHGSFARGRTFVRDWNVPAGQWSKASAEMSVSEANEVAWANSC